MTSKIARREDGNPDEGERKYGDVTFADPVNNKYPIDSPGHARAAWKYINIKFRCLDAEIPCLAEAGDRVLSGLASCFDGTRRSLPALHDLLPCCKSDEWLQTFLHASSHNRVESGGWRGQHVVQKLRLSRSRQHLSRTS